MKGLTKQQMREQIEELSNKLNEENKRRWEAKTEIAVITFYRLIEKVFPTGVKKVTFEHVDAGGYWFTFELSNDSTRQTFAVRHSDLPAY